MRYKKTQGAARKMHVSVVEHNLLEKINNLFMMASFDNELKNMPFTFTGPLVSHYKVIKSRNIKYERRRCFFPPKTSTAGM